MEDEYGVSLPDQEADDSVRLESQEAINREEYDDRERYGD